MERKELLREIEQTLGSVPGFIADIPDSAINEFWNLMKKVEMSGDTTIPPKYKELIGVAVAATLHCKYCSYFHREVALHNGATEDEVKEAVLIGSMTNLFSTYLNGTQYSLEQFKKEVDSMAEGAPETVVVGAH
jgi:AhpD family alkylhydroperoxidase